MEDKMRRFLLVCLLAVCVKAQGQNLLQNPDFEEAFNNRNWNCLGCTLDRNEDSFSGRFSGKVTGRSLGWHGVSQNVNDIKLGGHYRFEVHMKLLSQNDSIMFDQANVQVAFILEEGGQNFQRIGMDPKMRVDNGWVKLGSDFRIPESGVSRIRVYLTLRDVNTEHLVDYASLVELPDDADWREKANQRIDEIRKNNVYLNIDLGNSIDPSNAVVEVRQTKKSFPFGCVANADRMTADDVQSEIYRDFYFDMFNWGVLGNNMKWHIMEREWLFVDTTKADAALDILAAQGVKMRGHAVYWGVEKNVPYWLFYFTGPEVKVDAYRRAQYAATHFQGRVEHWDINNEHIHGTFFEEATGDPLYTHQLHRFVREFDADVKLFVNDYGIVSSGDIAYAMLREVEQMKANSVPVDAIGIQSHFNYRYPDITGINSRLDVLAEAGLPIWVTELDVVIADRTERAQGYIDVLTLFYSRPEIEGIFLWGFWDQIHWRPDGALLEGDLLLPNEAGLRVIDLMKNEWMTSANFYPQTQSDTFEFRGFHGDYQVTVKVDGVVQKTQNFELISGEDMSVTVAL